MDNQMRLKRLLKAHRDSGLSQNLFAKLIGVNERTMRRYIAKEAFPRETTALMAELISSQCELYRKKQKSPAG